MTLTDYAASTFLCQKTQSLGESLMTSVGWYCL